MCSPNASAHSSVSASPPPIERPCNEIRARPTVASPTAAHVIASTRLRSNTPAHSGVKTTNRPVMNPETDAGVCCSPMVWATYPPPSASPSATPTRRPRASRASTDRGRTAAMTIAAIANRQARKSMTGIRSTASLTTTNVDPQTIVTASSPSVASRCVVRRALAILWVW